MRVIHIRTYRRTVVLFFAFLVTFLFLFGLMFDPNSGWSIRRLTDSSHYNEINLEDELADQIQSLRIIKIGQDSEKKNGPAGRTHVDMGSCKIPKLEQNRPEIMQFYKTLPALDCRRGDRSPNWLEVDDDRRVQPSEYAKKKNLFMIPARNATRVKELQAIPRDPSKYSGLNVYILGFDSLSQMSFRRNMPKTVKYLEKVMGSTVFNGFNIVGDGTPQAFIPFLTGQTEEELPLTRKRYPNANFVDDVYPFAWRNFSDAGYATLYGEDSFAIGTFSYRLKGFRKQPTDHYVQTFFSHAEKLKECCDCVGAEPMHQIWFKYCDRFWKEYQDLPRFLLMHHSALSHDDINKVQMADIDLRDHLKNQLDSGAFDNTVVIVMADHGHRFAKLRDTQQGQLEERLPFFSLFIPPKLRSSPKFRTAYENLKRNAEDRLVTHFDVHPTLMDVLHWPDESTLAKVHDPASEGRALSLFREMPLSRTCDQAGVAPHWCTCLAWKPAMDDQEALETSQLMAKAVVQVINEETRPERKLCSRLKVGTLIAAKKLMPNEELLKYGGVKDMDGFKPNFNNNVTASFTTYQIVFETLPGKAKYEATVLHNVNSSITVDLTAISHINAYGDKPHCIIDKNYFLATWCVCYDKI